MSTPRKAGPQFRELTNAECDELLSRHHVARIAYSFHDRVDVEPIGYVYVDGGIVFRTAPGSKFMTLKHHPWIALEIDDVQGMFDWRSVVVHGTAYVLSDVGAKAEVDAYHTAVDELRRALPETLREDDPVPFRSVVMRLNIDRISGRLAASR